MREEVKTEYLLQVGIFGGQWMTVGHFDTEQEAKKYRDMTDQKSVYQIIEQTVKTVVTERVVE